MDSSASYQLNNADNLPFLHQLAKQKDSFIEKIRQVMHIGLLPCALGKLKTGIQDCLNNKLRKYDPQLDGILVGYDNLMLIGSTGHTIPGYCHVHINIQADFYVFNPKVGGKLNGTVLKKSGVSATCLTNQVFTVFVSFPPHLRNSIELYEEITFIIEKVDLCSQIPFVKGVLDEQSVKSSASAWMGEHIRFDTDEPACGEVDSGLSSTGCDSSTSVRSPSAGRVDTPRRRKKRKRADSDSAAADDDAADAALYDASDRRATPAAESRKRRSRLEAVSPSGERELYLPDPRLPEASPQASGSRARKVKVKREIDIMDDVLDDLLV